MFRNLLTYICLACLCSYISLILIAYIWLMIGLHFGDIIEEGLIDIANNSSGSLSEN